MKRPIKPLWINFSKKLFILSIIFPIAFLLFNYSNSLLNKPSFYDYQYSQTGTENTYINKDYEFSFTYPSHLYVKENTFESPSSRFNLILCSTDQCSNLDSVFKLNVVTQKFYESNLNNPSLNTEVTKVDNLDGIVKQYEYHLGYENIVFVEHNSNYYMIAADQENTILFDQILLTFTFSEGKDITQEEASELVSNLPEVKDYLNKIPDGSAHVIVENKDSFYLIHVFEVKNMHTATFNWYEVDKKTGKITPTF